MVAPRPHFPPPPRLKDADGLLVSYKETAQTPVSLEVSATLLSRADEVIE